MGDILFLAHRVPYPPNRGDKIRGFHILKHLSGHERVHLIAFADDTRDLETNGAFAQYAGNRSIIWRSKPRAVAALQALLARKPVSLTAFENARLREAVQNTLTRHAIDTIYVFSGQMAQYLPPNPRQRVIMDFVDMDSAKFASYAQESAGPMGWFLRREAKLLLAHEADVARRADASLFVSEAEADLFRARTGAKNVHAIENGIDTIFFDPSAVFEHIDTSGALIVFTGQMDYRPNIEGVTWFAEAMMPLIRARHPQARFAIVGRNPTDAVKALARHAGVMVTGEVADVRGWIAAAAVVVAPLKLARGVQNKVLEAMAMARPVVASNAAAEGIDHHGTIRVGETAAEIAQEVIAILDNPGTGSALGREARVRVRERYSWDARLAALDALLGIEATVPPRKSAA